MKVIVCRHTEDIGPPHDNQSRGLSQRGKEQAKLLKKVIDKYLPAKTYSSTFQRAIETTTIISEQSQITQSELLDEQSPGNSEEIGQKLKNNRGYISLHETYNCGESYRSLKERLEEFITQLQLDLASNPECNILIVTHGRAMTFLFAILLGFEPNGFNLSLDYGSYYVVEMSNDWRAMLLEFHQI